MWSGNVIDICDGHDLVNVVFQFKHLSIIIVRLEMYGLFRDLHREDKKNFITNAIQAVESFLFMRKGYKSQVIVGQKELISLVFFLDKIKINMVIPVFRGSKSKDPKIF
jgi:hypothetical protein